MSPFAMASKLFSMDKPSITLQQILSDPILKYSISKSTFDYYMSLAKTRGTEITADELLNILEGFGLIVIENDDLSESNGLSSLVTDHYLLIKLAIAQNFGVLFI